MKKLTPYVACLLLLSACVEDPSPTADPEEEIIEDVFMVVEERPTFKGGDSAWENYLKRAITYPKSALKEGAEGRVYVSFVVDINGKVRNAQMVRGVGHGIDEAALKAVRESPDWIPGKQRNQNVNTKVITTFAFEAISENQGRVTLKPQQKEKEEEIEFVEFVIPKKDDVYEVVEEVATFEGGMGAWSQHLKENLVYPSQARREGIEGRVFVTFIVGKDGKISDAKIAGGIGGGCDKVALDIVKNSPDWIPGKQRGIAVKSRMSTVINFKL